MRTLTLPVLAATISPPFTPAGLHRFERRRLLQRLWATADHPVEASATICIPGPSPARLAQLAQSAHTAVLTRASHRRTRMAHHLDLSRPAQVAPRVADLPPVTPIARSTSTTTTTRRTTFGQTVPHRAFLARDITPTMDRWPAAILPAQRASTPCRQG